MATEKTNSYARPVPTATVNRDPSQPHRTSISAHTTISVTVTMSSGDMDVLCAILQNADPLTDYQRVICIEFVDAINTIR